MVPIVCAWTTDCYFTWSSQLKARSWELLLRSFRRSHFGTARARIAFGLFIPGHYRFLGKDRPGSVVRPVAQTVFDDAIFQGMKADGYQSSGGLKQPGCGLQQGPYLIQFLIHVNAESLKGARRGMDPILFHCRGG